MKGTFKSWVWKIVVALSLATPAAAQVVPTDLMPVVVRPDSILIKTDSTPRNLTAPRVKSVPSGQTFEFDADSTFDYVEANSGATLRVSRTHNTSLKFQDLYVLPGGMLEVGTAADPIPCNVKVDITILSVPINTTDATKTNTYDPVQWGNALLNFGTRKMYGCKKLEWAALTAEAHTGDTTVTLTADPEGWTVGDDVLVTATDQPAVNTPSRRETKMTVAGVSGRTITLSKGFDFDHLAQRDPDGGVILLPRIANLTRNITIRSEDPNGTPGHVADVGHGAMWDVRYIASIGLGRTRAETLDNTVAEPFHIGLNQVGRYNQHEHHAMGFGSASVGNVYIGGGPKTAKWGMSVHGTHDALITRNIFIGFIGSGFVTEDGYEVRNVFKQNFGAYNTNLSLIATNPDQALQDAQMPINAPGIEGTCMWARGMMNTFDGNECWNSNTGLNLFNITTVAGAYPSAPGIPNDTLFTPNPDSSKALPVLVTGNIAASNSKFGIESWGLNRFPNVDAIASYNGQFQFNYVISNPTKVYLVNPTMVGKAGTTECISVSASYTETLEIAGGKIVGCNIGVVDGGAVQSVKVTGTLMQNVTNFDNKAQAIKVEYINVMHKPLPGFMPRYIEFGRAINTWPGPPAPLPGPPSAKLYYYQRGGRVLTLKNWQGTGQDFRLINPQQFADKLAWPAGFGDAHFFSPDANATMGQTWANRGQAWGGEAVDKANLVALEGVVGGTGITDTAFAAAGATTPLGPPRAVLTYPNNFTVTTISMDSGNQPYIGGYGLATGDPAAASEDFMFAIDGGATVTMQSSPDWEGDQRNYGFRTGLTPGTHTVKTWRTTTAGAVILASQATFTYCLPGPCSTAPVMVTVPNVVGMLQAPAGAALTAAGLTLGAVTSRNDALAPRTVLSQSPVATTQVASGSAVALVVSLGPVPVPVDVWVPITPTWQLLKHNGVFTGAIQVCDPNIPTATHCQELTVKQ